MSPLKRVFQQARAERNIDVVLPVLRAATLHVIVGSQPQVGQPPEWFLTESPTKERACVTAAESEATLANVAWPKLKLSGEELLRLLPPGIEIVIVYGDGGDHLTREQLAWYRQSIAEAGSAASSPMEVVHYPTTNQWVGTMKCSACQHTVRAWRSSGMSECWPHFYCERCSNVIYREADKDAAWKEQSLAVAKRIAAALPACSCGGRFRPGANPKCPACHTEFAHQHDVARRLTDPHMIVLHGACAFSDWRTPYRVEIDEV